MKAEYSDIPAVEGHFHPTKQMSVCKLWMKWHSILSSTVSLLTLLSGPAVVGSAGRGVCMQVHVHHRQQEQAGGGAAGGAGGSVLQHLAAGGGPGHANLPAVVHTQPPLQASPQQSYTTCLLQDHVY